MKFTRFTVFHVFFLAGLGLGALGGLALGQQWFGTMGSVIGGIIGAVVGSMLGSIPIHLADRAFFADIEEASAEELREMVAGEDWNFRHTMALLNLAAHEEDVRGELPRILVMLESDSQLERLYGWDALRLVFPPETETIGDYDPRESVELCREKATKLRNALGLYDGPDPACGGEGEAAS